MPRLVSTSTIAASLRNTAQRSSNPHLTQRSLQTLLRSSSLASPSPSYNSNKLAFVARTSSAAFSTSARTMGAHAGIGKGEDNVRPPPDQVIQDIADYVHNYEITSETAYNTARLCLLDSLGCAMEALRFPAAAAVCGPVVEGTVVPNGARVIGTNYELDPIRAAFNNGALIRWLDFNDTWLAAEWGHPSDNLGSILAVADWLSRTAVANGKKPLTVHDILTASIKAHEIQGCIALENSFNRVGLDHVVLVKVASTAVVSKMLGNTRDQTVDAISQAFVDGQSLRTYRHAPNAGSRKSWAAGDACSRAVNLALLVKKGEGGYNSVLTAKTWGFYDVLFKGQPFKFQRPYGSYVMENVLFKLVPAEFHSQTAVEAALQLYTKMKEAGKTSDDIKSVKIRTQEAAIRIISKQGKLNNYADRDHCIQYMVAVPLIFGRLTPQDYNDDVAADPRIDALREKMYCEEDSRFTEEYLEPSKRSIGNGVTVEFNDGSKLEEIALDYPVGHARRRAEAIPLIKAKLEKHLDGHFDAKRQEQLVELLTNHQALAQMPAHEFISLWLKK
ncbi:2-methylcitrate dehydratase [Violaceomyces palustris]|uniref:2-methylcitrate dehydratase n=1 Tax=Violaceomyces palustris TaxID=1673888 RepID=A0ACD0P3V0_9BASI|nr:2-methylcitrate dehydratase [Violaceomyces palustris]